MYRDGQISILPINMSLSIRTVRFSKLIWQIFSSPIIGVIVMRRALSINMSMSIEIRKKIVN